MKKEKTNSATNKNTDLFRIAIEISDAIGIDFKEAYYDAVISIADIMDSLQDVEVVDKQELVDNVINCFVASLQPKHEKDLA